MRIPTLPCNRWASIPFPWFSSSLQLQKQRGSPAISGLFKVLLQHTVEEVSWRAKWTKYELVRLFADGSGLFVRCNFSVQTGCRVLTLPQLSTFAPVSLSPFAAASRGFAQHSTETRWSAGPQTTCQVSGFVQQRCLLCAFMPSVSHSWKPLSDLPYFHFILLARVAAFFLFPVQTGLAARPSLRDLCLLPTVVFNLLCNCTGILLLEQVSNRSSTGHIYIYLNLSWGAFKQFTLSEFSPLVAPFAAASAPLLSAFPFPAGTRVDILGRRFSQESLTISAWQWLFCSHLFNLCKSLLDYIKRYFSVSLPQPAGMPKSPSPGDPSPPLPLFSALAPLRAALELRGTSRGPVGCPVSQPAPAPGS